MSEYLSYVVWRNREQSMPRELEHQRVIQERLREQQRETESAQHPQRLTDTQVIPAGE